MRPVIGILGGMGPRATVLFEQMLLDRLPGGDQELPTIISLNDGGIPDRSCYLLGGRVSPVPRIQRNLEVLETAGATLICLPCNTACAPQIFGRLITSGSELINLPDEVISRLAAEGCTDVYLLATEGTIQAGTYQSLCEAQGIRCRTPSFAVQAEVSAAIAAVKRGDMAAGRLSAARIRTAVAATRAEAVILGCTELPLIGSLLIPPGRAAIDTLAVLADSCVYYIQRQEQGVLYGN